MPGNHSLLRPQAVLVATLTIAWLTGCGGATIELIEGTYAVVQSELENACLLSPFPKNAMGEVNVRASRRNLVIDWSPSGFPGIIWAFRVEEDDTFALEDEELERKVWSGCTTSILYLYDGALVGAAGVSVQETVSFPSSGGTCPGPCESVFRYDFTLIP